MARTFLVLRVANAWVVRLHRITTTPDVNIGQIPFDDIFMAKDLAELETLLERLSAGEKLPPDPLV